VSIQEQWDSYMEAVAQAGQGAQFDGDESYTYPPAKWGDMLNERNHWKARCAVLEAKWNSIPWEDLEACVSIAWFAESEWAQRANQWLNANAPQATE